MEEENKILLTNLNFIDNSSTLQFIWFEQIRIIKKKEFSNNKVRLLQTCIDSFFGDFGGSRSNLSEY